MSNFSKKMKVAFVDKDMVAIITVEWTKHFGSKVTN